MKRNVSVVRLIVATRSINILSGKIIKEMPGSVASGTHGIYGHYIFIFSFWCY